MRPASAPIGHHSIARSPWPAKAAVLALVAAVAFGIAGWFVWTRYVPRSVTSINGQPLGHLPGGIRPSELNLLLVTLDTTRADRIHAYGFNGVETPNLDRLARE